MVKAQDEISVPVLAWAAWAPGLEYPDAWKAWATTDAPPPSGDAAPAIPFVDALMRRRLSRFARMALHVAHACAAERTVNRIVFASRHGELKRTAAMLHDIGRGTGVSPTDFSLSVHNAVAGVYSIVAGNRSPSVAVAAGIESFAYGFIEAAVQLNAQPADAVLYVYVDEPTVEEYKAFVHGDEHPHAVALLLANSGQAWVGLRRAPASGGTSSKQMQSLAFLRAFINQESETIWRGERSLWRWSVRQEHA